MTVTASDTGRASCVTCRYADPAVLDNVDGEGPDVVLFCHRYPPAMIADGDAVAPIWPLVNSTDWCGDHATAPTVAARRLGLAYVAHNLVAHPLLVLCPPFGEWLHDRTVPGGDGP